VTLFDRQLKTFLTAIVKRENGELEKGTMEKEDRLSGPMQDSWESCGFWMAYGSERSSNNSTLIKYLKDVGNIQKFALESLHKKTWGYYNKYNSEHVGVFHETFISKDGGHESMYLNYHPTLLGKSEWKGADWEGRLVSADTPE
jgi:hypothetical protein